jgi:small subunit ribosomal protein S16
VVRIRLRRMGAKKKPFYRIVVADQRSPRDGRFIEIIGTYDPHPEPPIVTIDAERASHWIRAGARPSDAVARLLRQQNILDDSGALAIQVVEMEGSQNEAAQGEEAEEGEAEAAQAESVSPAA